MHQTKMKSCGTLDSGVTANVASAQDFTDLLPLQVSLKPRNSKPVSQQVFFFALNSIPTLFKTSSVAPTQMILSSKLSSLVQNTLSR